MLHRVAILSYAGDSSRYFSRDAFLVHCVEHAGKFKVTLLRSDAGPFAAPQKFNMKFRAKSVGQKLVISAALEGYFRVPTKQRNVVGQFSTVLKMRPDYRKTTIFG